MQDRDDGTDADAGGERDTEDGPVQAAGHSVSVWHRDVEPDTLFGPWLSAHP
jgi:hypothetical protein